MIRAGLLLPALAGLLFLLLAGEWLLPGPSEAEWQPPAEIHAGAVADTSGADVAQWRNTILARPLLSQNRRPIPQSGIAVSDTLPRLSAIIVIGGTRHAIFAAAGQKPLLVAQGGEIGLYRIKTVAPDQVDLLGPNGPVTVKPQYLGAAPTQ
jgi:hypothetical protein